MNVVVSFPGSSEVEKETIGELWHIVLWSATFQMEIPKLK